MRRLGLGGGFLGRKGVLGPSDPFAALIYGVNFAADTEKGGFQTYGNNTNDGRLFRDGVNSVASFCPPNPDGSGTLVSVASSGLRRTTAGIWQYPSLTNRLLWNRDWTNVAWTKTNMTATKDQVGSNGAVNSATRLTATAANATISQTITLASGQVVGSLDIKRITGTGNIDISVDGTTFTTITGLDGTYRLKYLTQAAVTNPVYTIRIATSGDEVAVDFGHLITPANSMNVPKQERVATTTATVLNTQCRPTADATDVSPQSLILAARQPFAFFAKLRSERGNGAGIITGIDTTFCTVVANGGGTFASGGGTATWPDGAFITGLVNSNKVAGCFDGSGNIRVACNGQYGESTGATFNATLDHWDLGTNGNGGRSIYGVFEDFEMAPSAMFSQTELINMTT